MRERKPMTLRLCGRTLVVVCAMLGFASLPAVAQAAFPGKNGKIAFASGYAIWTIQPDGSDAKAYIGDEVPLSGLGKWGGPAYGLGWSADGQRLVYSAQGPWVDIHIADAGGTSSSLLFATRDQEEMMAAWSPDGTKIVFTRRDVCCAERLWVMNADGTNQTPLNITGAYPSWSPDGSKIAFTPESTVWRGIHVVNPDGSGERELAPTGTDPNWSPDGKRLVFIDTTDCALPCPNGAIFTVQADGSGRRQLTSGEVDQQPSWSPDGTRILFGRGLDSEPFTMAASGGDETRLASVEARSLDWQPIPGPKRSDFKNANQFCRAEQAFWGQQFAHRYKTFGGCVSRN